MQNYTQFRSPIGLLHLYSEGDTLVGLSLIPGTQNSIATPARENEILQTTCSQLAEYFAGTRKDFDINLKTNGTDFQKKAWSALRDIPYGETRSYAQQSHLMGRNKAVRAVGSANGKNPIIIVVPCHRVVRNNGSLGGYVGGLKVKEFLLQLEK